MTLGQQITIDGKSQQRNGWTSGASEGRRSAVIETVERRPTTKRLAGGGFDSVGWSFHGVKGG